MLPVYYGIYTGFLIAASSRPELKETFGSVVLYVVLPLTAFALFISLRKHRLSEPVTDPLPEQTDITDRPEDTLVDDTMLEAPASPTQTKNGQRKK